MTDEANISNELTPEKIRASLPRNWASILEGKNGSSKLYWQRLVRTMRVDSPDWEHILNLLKKTKAERDARLEATKKAVA